MSANISSTKVYQNLNNSIDGLLMFDSESDTIKFHLTALGDFQMCKRHFTMKNFYGKNL